MSTVATPETIRVEITGERLRQLLQYEPETGAFFWQITMGSQVSAGKRAGSVGARGYRRIRIERVDYSAARLAWFYVHGRWPVPLIDHINGARGDDRIANLREANHAQNNANAKRRSDQAVAKGVSFNRRLRKWSASIASRGVSHWLGVFETPEAAARAYATTARQLHGEFARVA